MTLYNFPPNNWEAECRNDCFVHVTWSQGDAWSTVLVGKLEYGEMRTYTHTDLPDYIPESALLLFSLDASPRANVSDCLPSILPKTRLPNWRATIELVSPLSSTGYQGELDPFPTPGSLLTFPPLIQFGSEIENYLLFLNIEKSPAQRLSTLEIYDSASPNIRRGSFVVRSNDISVLSLDETGIGPEDLPVLICKDMSAIPLYLSKTANGEFLSIEHTHPPASFVVHGERWVAQKILKRRWFDKVAEREHV